MIQINRCTGSAVLFGVNGGHKHIGLNVVFSVGAVLKKLNLGVHIDGVVGRIHGPCVDDSNLRGCGKSTGNGAQDALTGVHVLNVEVGYSRSWERGVERGLNRGFQGIARVRGEWNDQRLVIDAVVKRVGSNNHGLSSVGAILAPGSRGLDHQNFLLGANRQRVGDVYLRERVNWFLFAGGKGEHS